MSRSVGEFTLVGHLGEGSFATVFLARHRDSGRDFAMKAISRSRIQGKLQENLESEISILKSFRHVNIVELHDIKKTERHIYLVLEYCRGGDLRTLIRRHGRLAEPTVRHFMRHLGAGLHFLWSKSLVHRDLKPQNLLLSSPGLDAILKIADFGFARHLARASMAETICGSPLYMAPEILQGQKYGAKADLWSVGAILYEMLAGKPPFGGANQIQLLANIRRGPTPPPREGFYPLPEDIPPPGRACSELLCRLLVPDPEHRASFREFFQSDVLARSAPADALDSTSAALVPRSAAAPETRGDSSNRYRVNGEDPRAPGRDALNVGVEYSGHGQQQDQKQRVSVSQPRGVDVQRSQAEQGQGQTQGQERGRGGWWPLAGWRWGGGGDGQHDVPDSRGRGGRDDPRYGRLTRTFSDPPVGGAHHQQSRSQTPRGVRGGRGGGGDAFFHQQGSVARLSRGQLVAAQQQTGPSRPPMTPPSPSHGPALSRRYKPGAAVPIPIRKQQDTGLRSGDGGGESRGYRDRDTRMQEVGSPSGANTGSSDYPSSANWPRSGEEPPRDYRRERRCGDRDGDGEMVTPVQSRESSRLLSHGPNSAPEISYMGHAASRARERAAAAAAAAAAGLRGVAFSLTASPTSSPKVVPPQSVQPSTPRQGGRKNASISGGEMSSGNRHSRPPSLDLGARAPSDITVRASAGGQLTVTPSPNSTAGSVHAAGLTSMDRYPLLQVAAMVSAQRQRLWVDAGSFMPGTVSATMVVGSGAAEVEAGDGVGVERIRRRLEHEITMQQQGAAGGTRPAESSDGSGESDDFVIVDGALSDQAESPGAGSKRGGSGRGGEIGDAHRAYRIRGTGVGGGDGDARSQGSRLVPAEGRLVNRGGSGQAGKGLQQGVAGASRAAGEVQGGGERRGAGVPPLSLEGVMQCLQIVELFGRRAVLLAQLGDSRLAPAVQRRQRESLELQMGAGTGGDGWGVGDTGRVAAVGSVDQDTSGNASAFAKDVPSRPPLFAAEDDSWLLSPSSARAPVVDPVFGTAASCRGGGLHPGADSTNLSGTDDGVTSAIRCEPRVSYESDRLFGEALVLYLKSLSMAKEAIVWGNQALESLPAVAAAAAGAGANSAGAGTTGSVPPTRHPHVYPQPSPVSSPGRRMPPPGSPHARSPHKVGATRSGGGGMAREEVSRTPLHQPTGSAVDVRIPSQRSRVAGSSRVGCDSASPSSASAGGGGLGAGVSTASVLSQTQVAARGASLLGWLKGQFSTVLKRAEKCRVELRGSVSSPNTPKGSGVGRKYVPPSPPETTTATMVGTHGLPSAGARTEGMPPPLSRRYAPPSSPSARGSSPGDDCRGRRNEHGSGMPASPEAIAVSARDIVVRAALAQAQDSAASEVLGMWETARKGYEKAAFLLETLLLDALIARPEAGAGLARTSGGALGRSETLSPRRSPAIASPGGSTVLSGGEGLLSEADQRILQKYMTRFARRASEVAGIEKEEARAATSAVAAEASVTEGERRQQSTPVLRLFGDDDGEGGVVGGRDTRTPMRDSDGSI